MKKIVSLSWPLLISMALIHFSCENEYTEIDLDNSMMGKWLLYEYGSWSGVGYNTVPVPASPPQYIIIDDDNRIDITVNGLEEYKYYRIIEDTLNQSDVLALYKTDPGIKPIDLTMLEHSYQIKIMNGRLRLSFRYCYEGCHLAFKRVHEN